MKGLISSILILVLLASLATWWFLRPTTTHPPFNIVPTTQPTTAPFVDTTPPPPTPPTTLLDLIRESTPDYPTTQPLPQRLKFAESAKILINNPLHIDPAGDLWITHPNAPDLQTTLQSAHASQIHFTTQIVRYVRWNPDSHGRRQPTLITQNPDHTFSLIQPNRQPQPLPRNDYLWQSALDLGPNTFVPTTNGISAFTFSDSIKDNHFDYPNPFPQTPPPVLIPDNRGMLAFIPGSTTLARYLNGQWSTLPQSDDQSLLHLIPLLDGSLIEILAADTHRIRLDLINLDPIQVDKVRILGLVDQLSDLDQKTRDQAFNSLQNYGPGLWPILEPIADDQPPEARIRIRQLLKNRITPTLAGKRIINDQLQIVARQLDATAICYAQNGVELMDQTNASAIIAPAWLAIGPKCGIQLMPAFLGRHLQPDRDIVRFTNGEWIISDTVAGPRLWVGNTLVNLLDEEHAQFKFLLGTDRAGRWFFVANDPVDPQNLDQPVLIVDRHLPDTRPRLPTWAWDNDKAKMGWDDKGYPGMKSGGAFVLDHDGWRNLDLKKEAFHTPDPPPTTLPAEDEPILLTKDGGRYFGGNQSLRRVDPDGQEHLCDFPPEAVGADRPRLVQTDTGALYLWNQPGRLIRLIPATDQPGQYKFDAVFTKGIPNVKNPKRIWLDPAGRIVILADDHRLTLCFPEGRIPRPVSLLMPAQDEQAEW